MAQSLFRLAEARFERLRPLPPDEVRGVPGADELVVIPGIFRVLKPGVS